MELDLDWEAPLRHRIGADDRLCGIDVFHDFKWRDVFPDERTQFKNGKSLAKFVQDRCQPGKTPALLLTLNNVSQGLRQTDRFSVFVVNLVEYRAAEGDAAISYLANHLDVDITDVKQLQSLAESTDPQLLRTFIESSLDIGHIAEWALDNRERIDQLKDLVSESTGGISEIESTLTSIESLSELSTEDAAAVTALLRAPGTDMLREILADHDVLHGLYTSESPRESWRPIRLRGSGHDKTDEIPGRGA